MLLQFVTAVCDLEELNFAALGLDVEDIPDLDDACGAGTSDVDLTPEAYVEIITDAIVLLESSVGTAIPEEEIDTVCEVKLQPK